MYTSYNIKPVSGFKVKQFFRQDSDFLFIGQNSSNSKYVRGHLSNEGVVSSTTESDVEFKNLTKVNTL